MNRTMKMKNDKRKKLERQAKKERFYMVASHAYYAETLPASSEWFMHKECGPKMWWEV